METFKKVKVGGTIFTVGEMADFVNVGMGGMFGMISFIGIVGGFLYIFATDNKGIRVKLDENGDIPEGQEAEPLDTRPRRDR